MPSRVSEPVLVAVAFAALMLLAPIALAADSEPWRETYYSEAEVEATYGSSAEAISIEDARRLLLELVNATRVENQLQPVAQDELAARLALEHATSMAENGYVNHYSLEGLKCEARYNAIGGTDQVEENAAYFEIEHSVSLTPKLIARLHEQWMLSKSHKRNVLDPAHTHLGSAVVLRQVPREGGVLTRIAAVEEFLNDFASFDALPREAERGTVLEVSGQLYPLRARFEFVGLGSEDLPLPRTPEYQMRHIGGYSPPEPAIVYITEAGRRPKVPEAARYIRPGASWDEVSGALRLEIPVERHWPAAAYYLSVWASDPRGVVPGVYCVMTQVVLVKK
jgi:Cysteine-rich secretory protein family